MPDCPTQQLLERFLAGRLREAEEAPFREHVEACRRCQSVVLGLVGKITPVTRTATQPAPDVAPRKGASALLEDRTLAEPRVPEAHRGLGPPGYEVLGELGRGGMGVVYKARQLGLNRLTAVKMILAGRHACAEDLERFRAEAQAAAALRHPNIVQVYETSQQNGTPFFSMELVEDGTLKERTKGLPQPAQEAARCIESLAGAVQYAHERGIVHRDLKPANILFTRDGTPKITDFGLAKHIGDMSGQTRTGSVLGTPGYMAPEQARASSGVIGPAADVYALGAILYELLTGRPPFTSDTPVDVLHQVVYDDPVSVTRLRPTSPRDLSTITMKCLAKEPNKRYASAGDLAADLRRFLANEPIAARPPSALYLCQKFAGRNKALVGGVAATALALLLGTAFSALFAVGEANQRRIADHNAGEAKAAQHAALRGEYQARLMAAVAALGDHDFTEATYQLQATPVALRGWEWRHLHGRALDEAPTVVRGGKLDKDFVGFFPPGQRLVAADKDDRLHLVDALTGKSLRHLGDGAGLFPTVAQTRGGPLLLLPRTGGFLSLWDEAGTVRQVTLPDAEAPKLLAVSHDGTRLAAGWKTQGPASRIVVLGLPAGGRHLELFDQGTVGALALSPNGARLAVGGGGNDHHVRLWDTGTRPSPKPTVLQGHTEEVACLAFHPDGKHLLSGSQDQTIRQWDVATGRQLSVRRGHTNRVWSVAYSPDGEWVASGSMDRTVRVWRPAGGKGSVLGELSVDGGEVQVAFSPDGDRIATITAGTKEARVWPAPTQAELRILRHTSYVYPVAHSPDGRLLASAGWDEVIRLWDAASGEPIAALKGHKPSSVIVALTFSPDSRRLISRGTDATLRVWDTETGEAQRVLPCPKTREGDRGSAHSVVVTPDGKRVGTGTKDWVFWWDLASGKELNPLRLPLQHVRMLALSPDGRLLAASGVGPSIAVVALDTGEARAVLDTGSEKNQSLAFSPDGRQLLSAGEDRVLRLWDVETGTLVRELRGHTDEVFAAVFHPTERRIVSGGRDRAVRIWDADSGEELVRLRGHTSYIFSLSFSLDGATLASGSGDFTVRLWDTLPLAGRLEGRREREALRPEAERLVQRLLAKEGPAGKVAERLRAGAEGKALERAAWYALLRRAGNGPR